MQFLTIAYCLLPDACYHLITLSARASTLGGIARPICFAVFRLITSSNFAGCSTGRLERLAPTQLAELASPAFAGHTFGMKTAISIPDKIFHDAERLSRRLKKSRSQIYAEAVTEYIARHDPEAVTEAMNRVCEEMTEYLDPAISAAARRALEDVEW